MKVPNLGGVGVLVTRPAEQAASLASEIRQIGGVPTVFPGVTIEPVAPACLSASLQRLDSIDLVVFVSPTAVRIGAPLLLQSTQPLDRVRFAAIGQSTAAEMKRYGLAATIMPTRSSGAEALLDSEHLQQLSGWSVLIVRGAGGSEALPTGLRRRGARVSFLECYRRKLPDAQFAVIEPMLRDGRIGAWMATSGEILDNLLRLAGEREDLLRNIPLFVNHPHLAVEGFSRAIKVIFVTAGGEKGLAAGLLTWFCRLRTLTA